MTYHCTSTHNSYVALAREVVTSSIVFLKDAVRGRKAPDHGLEHEAGEQAEPSILATVGRRKGEYNLAI
jgi:hypothetical protein